MASLLDPAPPLGTGCGAAAAPPFRRYVLTLLGGTAFFWAVFFGVNVAGDPYADWYFLTGWRRPHIQTLDQYADVKFKTRLVREADPGGVGAAIFGSSRVMRINPAGPAFTEIAPRVLNLGIQGASLTQVEQFIALVEQRNPGFRPLVGLDFFAFKEASGGRSIYLDETHPIPAWSDALTRLCSHETFPIAGAALLGKRGSNRIEPNGLAVKPPPEPHKVLEAMNRFAESGWQTAPLFRGFVYDPAKIDQLITLRGRYPGIVFFVNPVPQSYRIGQQKAGLEATHARWQADLAKVGRVIDFSDTTEITADSRYYLDYHHYNSAAGALLMQDVANFLHDRPLRYGRRLGTPP